MVSGRQIGSDWDDLVAAGSVPDAGAGRTAEKEKRSAGRAAPVTPSEERRIGRKISPTLSRELITKLQHICKREGYVNSQGVGMIASSVIEDLLWAGIEAYERGDLVAEEVVTGTARRLRPRR